MFLVLLRIAIGWHFLYEGLEKYESTRKGGQPFSAEPYLRNAAGPLGPYFRGLVPDVNSLALLDPARLKARWAADVARISDHYDFTKEQRDKAQTELHDSEAYADLWFQDQEKDQARRKYIHSLREVQAVERNPSALAYERLRAAAQRKDLDVERRELIADLQARGDALREAVDKLATPEQRDAAGPYVPPMTSLDYVNLSTTYGLIAMGFCLMAGLLTRLGALAGAVFLAQIYLSLPPWPGLPPTPMAEGHYWIVNKNLIEMLACLSLACLPTGQWVGLDALLFGRLVRRRELERAGDDEPLPREAPRTADARTHKDAGPIHLS